MNQVSSEGMTVLTREFSAKLPLVIWEGNSGWYQYVKILKHMPLWDLQVGRMFFSKLYNSMSCVGSSFPILRESPEKVLDVVKLYVALKLGTGMVYTYLLASDFKSRITSIYESLYTVRDKGEILMEPCLKSSYTDLRYTSGTTIQQSNWNEQKCSPNVSREREESCKDEGAPRTTLAVTALVGHRVAYGVIQGAAEMCDKFLDYMPLVGNMFPWMSTAERQ